MERTRRTNGRLALLATPLLAAAVALALSACGSPELASSSPPTTNAGAGAGANTDAQLQANPTASATAQPAGDPVTVTIKPTAACPGKPITITATVGGSFKPASPKSGTTWDIKIYDEEGGLTGLPTLLHTNGNTLTFNWSSRVPGVYVMFVDVSGAPGSSGSTMTWFVVLPEFACTGKAPPDPGATPTPKPSASPKPSSTPKPTASPKPSATKMSATPKPTTSTTTKP